MSFTLEESWIILLAVILGMSLIGTKLLIPLLHKMKFFDVPNTHSLHSTPLVRGGGIAVFSSIVLGLWLAPQLNLSTSTIPISTHLIFACGIVFAMSLIGDMRPMPFLIRFAFQGLAVSFMLWQQPFASPIFHNIPHWADQLICFALWMWFINLFRAMDGIDGMSCMQTLFITAGIALVAFVAHLPFSFFLYTLILACAAGGFLVWNWQPAKILLGGSGSSVLGFMLGYVLLSLASNGYPFPALIIPLYYVFDSVLSLLKRLLFEQNPWKTTTVYFYQYAVRMGKSHRQTVTLIALVNGWLLVFAYFSLTYPNISLGLAAWVVLGLLAALTNNVPTKLKGLAKLP